jgi:hypothetical protein
MAYEIGIDEQQMCVLVTHTGEISLAESRDAQRDALSVIVEQGLSRVLIDVTGITNDLPSVDLFGITADLAGPGIPRPAAALVARPDQKAKARFIETVAQNRGLRIEAFTEREEALRSLCGR